MPEPFIAEISMFGGNFSPRGWAFCNGQLLPINSNEALFSLLGTTYGGDGRTSFGLPDLRGRVPMHAGSGPGLTPRALGSKGGRETETLNESQIPAHNHTAAATVNLKCSSAVGDSDSPADAFPASHPADEDYVETATENMGAPEATVAIGNTGGGQAHNNMQPFTCINFIIALVGIFPSRN